MARRPLFPLLVPIGAVALLRAPALAQQHSGDSVIYVLSPASRFEVKTGKAGLLGFAGHEHVIRARAFSGRVIYHPDMPSHSRVEIIVPTDSLEVLTPPDTEEIRKVTEAMRTEVLHADQYHDIKFASTALEPSDHQGGFRVQGALTLVGQTRDVTADVQVEIGQDSLRATTTFSIKQTDFGIRPYRGGPAGTVRVADRVTFRVEAVGVRTVDLGSHTPQAQEAAPVLVRVEDRGRVGPRNRVVVQDPRTGVDREVYHTQGTEAHIPYEVAVSPGGRYLSFIEVVSQTGAGKRRLTVIEPSGRIVGLVGESSIYAVRGIREYLWCCGPDTLAIITGGLADEGGMGESTTLPYGLSLLDVRTGVATPIEGLRFPVQIHWAAFDSSLYIKDSPDAAPGARGPVTWPIYRYHLPTSVLSRTTHRGVFFSPDGKYYFDPSVEGSEFRVYRAADDQDVTAALQVPPEQVRWGPEFGWMPGADHVLVFIEKPPRPERKPGQGRLPPRLIDPRQPQVYPDRWNLAVDAETGRVIQRFQGDGGAGWKTNAPMLPVERRTGVELVRPPRP